VSGIVAAVRLLRARSELLTERYDLAERFYALEWIEDILQEKALIVGVLRALVEERDPPAGLTVDLNVQIVTLDARSWEAERRMRRRLADPDTRDRVLEAVERALDELADDEGDA
jgi:hypothetical protein